MSFLDKVKNSASAASQAAVVAAGKAGSTAKTAAAVARLKVNIAAEEDKLKKAYTELGRLFLRDLDTQADADMTDYTPWCEKAHDARDAINRMTEEMNALKAQLRSPATAPVAQQENTAQEPAAVSEPAAPDATGEAEEVHEADNEPEVVQDAAEVPADTTAEQAVVVDDNSAVADDSAVEEEDTSIFADAE